MKKVNIAEELKQHRKVGGYSQSQVAAAIGVTQQAVSLWESGNAEPTISFCIKLADFYGITLDELVGREE